MHELKRLVDSGQYLAAIRRFEERLGSGELGSADLALGYHFVSVAHFGKRDVFRAQMFAEKAAGLAGKIGDVQTQLRAWSNLVEYARNLGDYGLAVEYGDKWLGNIHRCPGEAVRQGRVHYNLGLVYRHRKDPEEALRHFKAALETLPATQTEFRLMVVLMTAWLCYEIRHIDEATASPRTPAPSSKGTCPCTCGGSICCSGPGGPTTSGTTRSAFRFVKSFFRGPRLSRRSFGRRA